MPRFSLSRTSRIWAALITLGLLSTHTQAQDSIEIDASKFQRGLIQGIVPLEGEPAASFTIEWPVSPTETGSMTFNRSAQEPLIKNISIRSNAVPSNRTLLVEDADPITFITLGSREGERDRPPGMSPFNVFFDNPWRRPYETNRANLTLKWGKLTSEHDRATIAFGDVTAGPFTGEIRFTVYAGSRLIHVETILKTDEPNRAFTYDTGLVSAHPKWKNIVWLDTEGKLQREPFSAKLSDRAISVRHRAIVAESEGGSLACLPLPHQYFYPRDVTDNLGFTWAGANHRKLETRAGFGIRQPETGGGPYVPWFNAPPGTEQHLGVFYLITKGSAEEAIDESLRYTRKDRFVEIPGYKTFTSHWHMAISMAALAEQAKGGKRSTPDFVKMFHDLGVNIVHLAEFHGDGHPQDPGPARLKELDAMFDECRRLSDDSLLFLPGEEANVHLRPTKPGNPGHWLYLFPKPVRWTMVRGKDQPFVEEVPGVGRVYHVGNRTDMKKLIDEENGLAWTAHARIKASTWAPDIYRNEDFFTSNRWLGAAWKAMPADLSRPKLGERTLNLLDDMSNWGNKKQLIGEVDVFKIDHTHELYGAMNVNYLKLDRIPKFDESWHPVLDSLRAGNFFVTTGEMLLRDFKINGKSSGETVTLSGLAKLSYNLEWTFPPAYLEVISGDGANVHRQRIDLSNHRPFDRVEGTVDVDLKGRRWVRIEAWDIARNGVFSQPVWIAE